MAETSSQMHRCKSPLPSSVWVCRAVKGEVRLRAELLTFAHSRAASVHDSLLLSVQMPQRIRLKLINGCYYNTTHPNQTCHISRGTLPCFHCVCVRVILEEGSAAEIERAHWGAHRCNQICLIHMTGLLAFPAISFPILCSQRETERERKKAEALC